MTLGTSGAQPATQPRRSRWASAAMVIGGFVAVLYVIEAVDVASGLALDRHGKAAGTAQSIIGAANFGVAGVVSPLVGALAVGTGITATTMATLQTAYHLVPKASPRPRPASTRSERRGACR